MKRMIDGIILAMVFALLVGTACVAFGWKIGFTVWATGFVLALIIVIVMYLIEEGER